MSSKAVARYNAWNAECANGPHNNFPGLKDVDIEAWKFADGQIATATAMSRIDGSELLKLRGESVKVGASCTNNESVIDVAIIDENSDVVDLVYEDIFERQYEIDYEYEQYLHSLQPIDYNAKLKTEFIERTQKAGVTFSDTLKAYESLSNGRYEEMASYFSTASPKDGVVFWSGDLDAAINYAKSIDGIVMEITPGGNVFNDWDTLGEVYPSYKWGSGGPMDQKPIWEALSRQYAYGARGKVSYVHPDGYYGNVWKKVELKALKESIKQGKVTSINEVVINGKQ